MAVTRDLITRVYPAAATNARVRDAAVLDIGFDYLLHKLGDHDVYDQLGVTFKGGTALRKYRLGPRSRFSFDLDFDCASGAESLIAEVIDGMSFPEMGFAIHERRGHYLLEVSSDLLSDGRALAKIDFSTRGVWCTQWKKPIQTPLHPRYSTTPNRLVPVQYTAESIAEKLGRWQHRPLIRDLYDIATLANYMDPVLVSRMWVLKAHQNMTMSDPRFRVAPAASIPGLTAHRTVEQFALEDLVLPTNPSITDKTQKVRQDIARVAAFTSACVQHLTPTLQRIANDRGQDTYLAQQQIAQLRAEYDRLHGTRLPPTRPQPGPGHSLDL